MLQCRSALDTTLAAVRGFAEQRKVTAAEVVAWVRHADVFEVPLQAPTQAFASIVELRLQNCRPPHSVAG